MRRQFLQTRGNANQEPRFGLVLLSSSKAGWMIMTSLPVVFLNVGLSSSVPHTKQKAWDKASATFLPEGSQEFDSLRTGLYGSCMVPKDPE